MSPRALCLTILLAAMMAPMGFADEPKIRTDPKSGKSTYEPTRIWRIHLQLPADEYAAMQPKGSPRFGPAPKPPEKPPEKNGEKPKDPPREIHRNTFGMDLPWAFGSITIDGDTFDKVGIRYKGNGTIVDAGRTARKSFKIDLDRYDDMASFLGAKGVNLHCGVADPSRTRETIGYALYRAAGVPAPRTTLAEVRLTVPGKFDKELLGVYTIVEPADKAFLRAHFGDGSGLLMKPEGASPTANVRDLAYRGDDWAAYEPSYAPKRPATKDEGKRMVDFFRLVHKSGDDEFRKEIGNYLDTEGYLRFLAMTSLQANMDSFFALGHNFYVYLHPKTNRLHFFPWDLDRSFANIPFLGSSTQQMDLSLTKPYAGPHKLTERLLAMPQMSERYREVVKEILAGPFAAEKVFKQIETMDAAVKDLIAAETKSAAARKENNIFASMFAPPRPPALKTFVEKRTASATAQLEGTSKGFVPVPFGFPGVGGGPPKVGDMMGPPLLTEFDADKDSKLSRKEWLALVQKIFAAADPESQGWTEEKSLAAGVAELLPKGPKDVPKAPPGGPMKGFNPAAFLAAGMIKRADLDKNGKVTRDEFLAAAEKLFDDFDRTKTGTLPLPVFRDLLTELFPAAPPPVPPPADDKKKAVP